MLVHQRVVEFSAHVSYFSRSGGCFQVDPKGGVPWQAAGTPWHSLALRSLTEPRPVSSLLEWGEPGELSSGDAAAPGAAAEVTFKYI